MTTNKPEVVGFVSEAGIKNLREDEYTGDWTLYAGPVRNSVTPLIRLSDYEALQAEYDRLAQYYKNGIECFANPCEKHSGENTPPFSEFFERYGGQCLICVVDNNKALQAEYRILESELATVKKVAYGNVDLLDECEKLRADNSELREKQPNPDVSALVEALEAISRNELDAARAQDIADEALAAYRKLGGGS